MPRIPKDQPIAAPDDVRERLHAAVFDVLAEKRWDEVNIRMIATRSGVSSATIYKYYASKEGLVLEVVKEQVADMTRFVQERIALATNYRDKWYRMFRALMEFNDRHPQFAMVTTVYIPTTTWFSETSMPTQLVHEIYKPLVREGRRLGAIDPKVSNANILRLIYMYMAHEILLWYTRGREWEMAPRVDGFFFIFWKAIAANDATGISR